MLKANTAPNSYVQGRGKLSRHCTSRSKMESIHNKNRMKGQGSHELVEEVKTEKLRKKIDNRRFLKSLVHAYSTVCMNDLGLYRKVFCQRPRLQSYKTYNFTCSKLFLFL